MTIRLEIKQTSRYGYSVHYNGELLLQSVRDPEHAACRALVERGVTGKAETFFPGSSVARMRLDIERAAKLTARECGAGGLSIRKYVPFGGPDA